MKCITYRHVPLKYQLLIYGLKTMINIYVHVSIISVNSEIKEDLTL